VLRVGPPALLQLSSEHLRGRDMTLTIAFTRIETLIVRPDRHAGRHPGVFNPFFSTVAASMVWLLIPILAEYSRPVFFRRSFFLGTASG